jgi:hypothetical protein
MLSHHGSTTVNATGAMPVCAAARKLPRLFLVRWDNSRAKTRDPRRFDLSKQEKE